MTEIYLIIREQFFEPSDYSGISDPLADHSSDVIGTFTTMEPILKYFEDLKKKIRKHIKDAKRTDDTSDFKDRDGEVIGICSFYTARCNKTAITLDEDNDCGTTGYTYWYVKKQKLE